MKKRKIALFGGSFDPIHLGHMGVASAAREFIGAEKVVFIPAKRSALKESPPTASGENRATMALLAIADNEKFELSDYELGKAGASYTLDTVRHFSSQYGSDAAIYWLIGADSVKDLPYWYKIKELIDECNLCVMLRGGCERPDFAEYTELWGIERVRKLQDNVIETPLINISSTEIRGRLAKGLDVGDMLDPAVAEYIEQHNLYKSCG